MFVLSKSIREIKKMWPQLKILKLYLNIINNTSFHLYKPCFLYCLFRFHKGYLIRLSIGLTFLNQIKKCLIPSCIIDYIFLVHVNFLPRPDARFPAATAQDTRPENSCPIGGECCPLSLEPIYCICIARHYIWPLRKWMIGICVFSRMYVFFYQAYVLI